MNLYKIFEEPIAEMQGRAHTEEARDQALAEAKALRWAVEGRGGRHCHLRKLRDAARTGRPIMEYASMAQDFVRLPTRGGVDAYGIPVEKLRRWPWEKTALQAHDRRLEEIDQDYWEGCKLARAAQRDKRRAQHEAI